MNFRNKLPIYYIATASLYSVLGMFVGLYQHLSHDKKPIPFHGHLDSLGWLSLALVGVIAQLYAWSREHPLAVVQFILLEAGTFLMLGGLPLAVLHVTSIPVTIGALLVPLGFVVFSIVMLSGLRHQTM